MIEGWNEKRKELDELYGNIYLIGELKERELNSGNIIKLGT
jgi:hypothetical protein